MRTSLNFNWFSSISILFFTFFFSILICAAPAPEAGVENHDNVVETLFPHYILHAFENRPDDAEEESSFTADISFASDGNEVRAFFGFDVPNNGARTCSIKFGLPRGQDWVVTGSGKLNFYQLDGIIRIGELTWNHRPPKKSTRAIAQVTQPRGGGTGVVTGESFPCRPGRMDFEVLITRPQASRVYWFELARPKTGFTLDMSY